MKYLNSRLFPYISTRNPSEMNTNVTPVRHHVTKFSPNALNK